MQRISTATRAIDLFGTGKDGFQNAVGETPGTQFDAAFFNSVQEELCAVVEAAGISLNVGVRNQLASAIQSGKPHSAAAAGTVNAVTATFMPAIATLFDGMIVQVKCSGANTGAVTFAPNGLTAKSIVRSDGAALIAGDLTSDYWAELQWSATDDKWLLRNPAQPSDFLSAQSLSINGYQVLPGGLIFQWGKQIGVSGSTTGSVSFPISFPSAVLNLTFGDLDAGSSGVDVGTGFTAYSLSGFDYAKSVSRDQFFWLVLGY